MKPEDRERRLSRYLDGELSDRERREVEKDLAARPEQAEQMKTWARYGTWLREAGPDRVPAPEAAWREVRDALHRAPPRGRLLSFPTRPVFLGWAAGLAAAFAVAASLWMLRPGRSAAVAANSVNFAETEVPGASPMVYIDEDTGCAVVWIVEPNSENAHDAG